jgi:hypothetical protein
MATSLTAWKFGPFASNDSDVEYVYGTATDAGATITLSKAQVPLEVVAVDWGNYDDTNRTPPPVFPRQRFTAGAVVAVRTCATDTPFVARVTYGPLRGL